MTCLWVKLNVRRAGLNERGPTHCSGAHLTAELSAVHLTTMRKLGGLSLTDLRSLTRH